ncbi:MAG TPA: isoprenylcysteine carboxylmethyltransferase family protein [Candidatus Sulfotelmatobacter sp.]|nr:isoprenylcysteine carboxylmethyltransferase family protein [Candidatus Sulfotelmatobacter sp.]
MHAMRICSDLWMVLGIIWLVTSLRTKQTQERVDVGSRLIYGIPVVLAFYLMFANDMPMAWLRSRIVADNLGVVIAGITLTGLGIAFAVWARFYIGQNWSSAVSIKVGHQLVRTGPYAWVRHPIYSGLLLAMIGTALALRESRGLIAIVVLWLAFWVKSRMEERLMLKAFGPEYKNYSRSTGALVPRLLLGRFRSAPPTS